MTRTDELERDVERALVRVVEGIGGRCLKWVCPGNAGVPDRLLLLPGGRAVFVELKRPGQKPRPLQRVWADRLRALGFPCWVVSSKEEADLLAFELARLCEGVTP